MSEDLGILAIQAAQPAERLTPSEWASGRVALQDGLTPKYQTENAPWQIAPLDAVGDPDVKECVYLAPIGTGKTTFMEAALSYVVSQDPGPTLLVGQTDDDLKDWAETRLDYSIRNTPDTAQLLPKDRHSKQKMKILFPHMALFMTGANLSGLQAKSMRRVFMDEVWTYKPAMVNEGKGRLHDRWNRQLFMLSQAGNKGDDLDKAWEQTNQCQFMFTCPECGTVQPWQWCNVGYSDDEELPMLERAKTAHIKCGNDECDWVCPDKTQDRRKLAEGAEYVATYTGGLPGHVGFHYNVLCNWRKPLWEIVLLWLEAKKAQRVGNLDPLRQFIQKRLAEPWEEDLTENREQLVGSGYLVGEYTDGQKVENEAFRFLTADVQRDHFWVGIRAWRADGSSRHLLYEKVQSYDQILELQRQYKVQPKMVFIDAQYMTDKVYSACAAQDWTALHGSGRESFPYRQRDGNIIHRPFTRFSEAQTTRGKPARYAHWASDRVKDILHAHRTGQAGEWEIPDDVSQDWLKQIDGEAKREVTNAKTKQVDYRWTKVRRDNHAWDVEAMQIVAALMLKLIPGFDA